MAPAGRRTSAWHGGQARAIGFAAAVNGTAHKDVPPHRPIAPGTSGVRCPPRTPMFRGLFLCAAGAAGQLSVVCGQ